MRENPLPPSPFMRESRHRLCVDKSWFPQVFVDNSKSRGGAVYARGLERRALGLPVGSLGMCGLLGNRIRACSSSSSFASL